MKKLKEILASEWAMVLFGVSVLVFEFFWLGGE